MKKRLTIKLKSFMAYKRWVKPPLTSNGLCFFDCETSGLDPLSDEIIQMACVITDFSGKNVKQEAMWLIKPTKPVSAEVAAINHYEEERWNAEGIDLSKGINNLLGLADQTIFAAHNTPFDWSFVYKALQGNGLKWRGDYHRIDTAALSWPLLAAGKVPNVKLDTMANYFQIAASPTHDALADVRACREIYVALMELFTEAIEWG